MTMIVKCSRVSAAERKVRFKDCVKDIDMKKKKRCGCWGDD